MPQESVVSSRQDQFQSKSRCQSYWSDEWPRVLVHGYPWPQGAANGQGSISCYSDGVARDKRVSSSGCVRQIGTYSHPVSQWYLEQQCVRSKAMSSSRSRSALLLEPIGNWGLPVAGRSLLSEALLASRWNPVRSDGRRGLCRRGASRVIKNKILLSNWTSRTITSMNEKIFYSFSWESL